MASNFFYPPHFNVASLKYSTFLYHLSVGVGGPQGIKASQIIN